MRVEEKIARAYHHSLSWRKVLVRLEPDAHNNMVVRRMFANAYGWPVVQHLCETHFADTLEARVADEGESGAERAILGEEDEEGPKDEQARKDRKAGEGEEETKERIEMLVKRTDSETLEAKDTLRDLPTAGASSGNRKNSSSQKNGSPSLNTVPKPPSRQNSLIGEGWNPDDVFEGGEVDSEDEEGSVVASPTTTTTTSSSRRGVSASSGGSGSGEKAGTSEAEITAFLSRRPVLTAPSSSAGGVGVREDGTAQGGGFTESPVALVSPSSTTVAGTLGLSKVGSLESVEKGIGEALGEEVGPKGGVSDTGVSVALVGGAGSGGGGGDMGKKRKKKDAKEDGGGDDDKIEEGEEGEGEGEKDEEAKTWEGENGKDEKGNREGGGGKRREEAGKKEEEEEEKERVVKDVSDVAALQ